MLTLPTLYQHFTDRKDEEFDFDECSQLRSRSKRTEEGKKFSKQMCVSSQNKRVRKEDGATATASHLPSLSWLSHQAGPAAFFHGRTQNSGKLPLNTENVLLTKHLIDSPKQMYKTHFFFFFLCPSCLL